MSQAIRKYRRRLGSAPGQPGQGAQGTPTLVMTTAPSSNAQSGVAFGVDPVIQLQDGLGNNISLAGVTVTVTASPAITTTVAPSPLTTDANGTATVSSLTLTGAVGSYRLTFAATGYASVVSQSISLSAGTPNPSRFTANVPSSVTVNQVRTVTVQARDGAGNPCTSASNTVVENINGANTAGGTEVNNNNGTYTCTDTPTNVGTDTITITADGIGILGSPFTSHVAAASTSFPNQPAGMTRIAETNFSNVPVDSEYNAWTSTGMTAGQRLCYMAGDSGGGVNGASKYLSEAAYSLANMISATGTQKHLFPAGFVDGQTPGGGGVSYWQAGGAGNFNELYYSFTLQAVGRLSDGLFQTHAVNQKLFYVPYADTTRSNHSFLFYEPAGTTNTLHLSIKISQMNDNGSDPGGAAIDFPANLASIAVAVGSFAKVEVYMKVNTHTTDPAPHDGIFKMWVNGFQTHGYANIRYVSAANSLGFYRVKWDPVFGGNDGEVIAQNQWLDLDHLYLAAR